MAIPDKVRDYFLKKARVGIVLNSKELLKYCKLNGISCREDELRTLRREWKFLAIFSAPKKITHWMGMALPRYGILQVKERSLRGCLGREYLNRTAAGGSRLHQT
jgi:hypothetical protein